MLNDDAQRWQVGSFRQQQTNAQTPFVRFVVDLLLQKSDKWSLSITARRHTR